MPIKLENRGNVTDYLLGLDDLQQPKKIDMSILRQDQWNSAILMITRLLLMKKGIYPDQPEMGIDIRGRYRFSFEEELYKLQDELDEQINTYLPEFRPIEVYAKYKVINKQRCIVIQVSISQGNYELIYNTDKNTIEGLEGI